MLACRPMLFLSVAVMSGSVLTRFGYVNNAVLLAAWSALAFLLLWIGLTPASPFAVPHSVPPPYHEFYPLPGPIARRGLNRCLVAAGLVFFMIGCHRQTVIDRRWNDRIVPHGETVHAVLIAKNTNQPYPLAEGDWRILANVVALDGRQAARDAVVQLTGPRQHPFRCGDRIEGRVRFFTTPSQAYPGAFDPRVWLERDGALASGALVRPLDRAETVWYAVEPDDSPGLVATVRRWLDSVRSRGIAGVIRHGGPHGGMLAAMLFGYRNKVDAGVRDTFRRIGIGHVLAISGLHVGLMVGTVWWLTGWLGWLSRRRALFCMVFALIYLGLSGGQVAAVRATIMACIHFAGLAMGRRGDMLNSLGAAAFIICLATPSAPVDVSFQLSFTAVVFIYLGLRGIEQRRVKVRRAKPRRGRVYRETFSLVRLSVATWVGLFPLIAFHFNQVNLIGLPINIVVIPLMGLVLIGGLLLPLVGWMPAAAWICRMPSVFLAFLAEHGDAIPMSSLPVHSPSIAWIWAFYLAAFVFAMRGVTPVSWRPHWRTGTVFVLVAVTAGLLHSMRSEPPPPHGRIALLPGFSGGVIAAEAPDGAVAFLGTVSSNGLRESGWLHYLKRDCQPVMLSTARRTPQLTAMPYHFPAFRKELVSRDPTGWQPVPGAESIEYAASHTKRGGLAWLAVRAGDQAAVMVPWLSTGRRFSLQRRPPPAIPYQVVYLNTMDITVIRAVLQMVDGAVVLADSEQDSGRQAVIYRDRYGAIVAEDAIRGYRDGEWELMVSGGDSSVTP